LIVYPRSRSIAFI